MTTTTVKEEVQRLADRLPDEATWDDVEYEIYVRRQIDAGLKDSREGRIVSHTEVRRQFGLESDPAFLTRVEVARESIAAGLGVRLEDLPD